MYQRILVPIDGSDASRQGLEQAMRLAKALGARLRLLHVMNQRSWVSPGSPPDVLRSVADELRGNAESLLHEAARSVRDRDIAVDTRLIEAPDAEAGDYILSEARAWPAELIVCGTHGRRGIRRVLMGSDAEYVLRHSEVPVLLVHGQGNAGAKPD